MIELPWKRIHFVGVGGAGMTGLALLAAESGSIVTGSDKVESGNTTLLRHQGIKVNIGHSDGVNDNIELVIYSSAIVDSNTELAAAHDRQIKIMGRGQFLAALAAYYPRTVAIAGAHGKTTVSAMLSQILIDAELSPGYVVGGEITGRRFPASAGSGDLLIAEMDESDGSQAHMYSTDGVIINLDDDHCWSLGGFDRLMQCFHSFGHAADYLFCCDSPKSRELFFDHKNVEFFSNSDIDSDLVLIVPGDHNLLNASVALHMAEKLGVDRVSARASLRDFRGVDRRLSTRYQGDRVTVIEDYAHHPNEVRESLKALRKQHSNHRLLVVFQPHRYERVARYAKEFAAELGQADAVIVTTPFNAWIDDQNLTSSKSIVDKLNTESAYYFDGPLSGLASFVYDKTMAGDLITIMGAGDITGIVPELVEKYKAYGF